MNAEDEKALASGESETEEFKTSFDKNTIETLVAFANTRGGDVLIGVSDRVSLREYKFQKRLCKTGLTRSNNIPLRQ